MSKTADHITMVDQPDNTKAVVQCQRCGEARSLKLPKDVKTFTKFLGQMVKDHKNCQN